jgi:hypothetical protein
MTALPDGLISYQGKPLILDEVLIEDFKMEERLFGNSYLKLSEKLQDAEKTHAKMKLIFGSLMAAGITFAGIGGTLNYIYTMKEIVGVIGCVGGVTAGGVSIICAIGGLCYANRIDDRRLTFEAFSEACFVICNAHNTFENFKIDPDVAKVKNLFATFNKIHLNADWCHYMSEEKFCDSKGQIVNKKFVKLCGSVGKLFLMDAVVSILKGDYLTDWHKTLELANSLETSQTAEPWAKLKIPNTDLKAYHYFKEKRHQLNSLRVIPCIVDVFKRSLQYVTDKK